MRIDGVELLAQSDAVIINIDYPLGMAAYHHFTRLSEGVGELRGVYLMGKAATLNGRVGDIMLSTAAYDEHSQNTHLFRNAFAAADVQPWVHGTVLDNQKALTVRGSFLQNREYMQVFYREGYTVLEMETGPYLSGIYELVYPKRHPTDEIVHLSNLLPFDLGVLHYASDTPYSRRQTLLSKSLSYFAWTRPTAAPSRSCGASSRPRSPAPAASSPWVKLRGANAVIGPRGKTRGRRNTGVFRAPVTPPRGPRAVLSRRGVSPRAAREAIR
ncbi:MAG: hypothetical protein IPK74_24095 [Deltaproteobacteria bacterium]|nr:hypothetical protein [Deltaproteobacteria bacterium]